MHDCVLSYMCMISTCIACQCPHVLSPLVKDVAIRMFLFSSHVGLRAVSIHWTGLLDWITGLTFDSQIPTKMSNFSAVDSPKIAVVSSLVSVL